MGLLEADGKVLTLPIKPLQRGSEQIFKRDYYPVLETVDWDNDGDTDLLAGGYVTGRVFIYENQGGSWVLTDSYDWKTDFPIPPVAKRWT